jgi:hypothetical protein
VQADKALCEHAAKLIGKWIETHPHPKTTPPFS